MPWLSCVSRVWAQVNYLNKSLDTFNTQLVYPIYYVLFTSVVLSTSIILFQEWRSMATVDVVTTLGAFMVIVVGVAMLHLFKEMQVCQTAGTTSGCLILNSCWTLINLHAKSSLDDDEAADQSAVSSYGEGGTVPGGAIHWANGGKPSREEQGG